MNLEREGTREIVDPTPAKIRQELGKLRNTGPSTFASLTAPNGDYLQTAGGRGGLLLEKRSAKDQRHHRAFQDTPVVSFADGTLIVFNAGPIPLNANEWFEFDQIVEAFIAFSKREPEPDFIRWRDITALVNGEPDDT